jgi:hypothetical protein
MNNLPYIPSITSLHEEKNKKILDTNDIYKTVLNKCIEKIIYTNKHTDKTFVIFEVPKILIGHSNYNMKSCIHFIINNIITHGYLVQFIEPFYIYIDWGSDNKNVFTNKFGNTTKQLFKKYPNIDEIEYVYEDNDKKKYKKW